MSQTRVSSPIGLHRVLEPAGVLPQAAQRLDATSALWPDEVRVAVEVLNLDAASYRQLAGAHPRTQRGSRRRGGPGRGAGHRREPRQDAEPGHRLGRHARRHGRRGRARVAARPPGRRPGRHAGLPVADPAADHRRPGPLGRAQRAGRRPRATPSCSAARSPPCIPDDLDPRLSLMVMDVCGAPALVARVVRQVLADAVRTARLRPSRSIGGAGKSGLARPGRGARRRRRPHGRHRAGRARARDPRGRRAGRRRGPRRRPRPGGPRGRGRGRARARRPTSPSSASTSRAASTARSWPPPRAAR